MATTTTLGEQLAAAKEALAREEAKGWKKDDAIYRALKAQVADLNRKVIKAAGSKVTVDGKTVGVGDTVYGFTTYVVASCFSSKNGRAKDKAREPEIEAKKIIAVSPSGEIAFGTSYSYGRSAHRPSYVSPKTYFSSRENAVRAIIKQLSEQAKHQRAQAVEYARIATDMEKDMKEFFQPWAVREGVKEAKT